MSAYHGIGTRTPDETRAVCSLLIANGVTFKATAEARGRWCVAFADGKGMESKVSELLEYIRTGKGECRQCGEEFGGGCACAHCDYEEANNG